MAKEEPNLIDLARAEDFTEDDFKRTFSETEKERQIIEKLKSSGSHIIEGSRGVGKSSLMKKAEFEMDAAFSTNRTLSIYVNFKASLLVDTNETGLGYDPFLCWVAAKILDAFYKKCRKIQLLSTDKINQRYRVHFNIQNNWSIQGIEHTIRCLQSLAIASTNNSRTKLIDEINEIDLDKFANIESVSSFIREFTEIDTIDRIVFLFDEAAHTFSESQQVTFFQFFKLIHGNNISVKAATYPGITSYGGNFEIGHDAVKITINPFNENLEIGRKDLRDHFRKMLQKRVSSKTYGKYVKKGEALDLLILLSHGNPRAFLQTVSKWAASKELSKRSALAASNEFVSNEMINYHLGLKQRLPRFASHIDLGMALLKAHLVPEIQKKNEGKEPTLKVQTIYFTIETTVPYKIIKSISLLEYSGFLFSKSVVKIRQRKQAPRFAVNLGLAANDKMFHSSFSRDPDNAIYKLSIADYREFYESDPRFNDLISDHPTNEICENGHPRVTEGPFCPLCGGKFAQDSIIQILLKDPIDKLSLTTFLLNKLTQEFKVKTVENVLTLTESDLQKIKWIGPIRARIIVNAAEEYITG